MVPTGLDVKIILSGKQDVSVPQCSGYLLNSQASLPGVLDPQVCPAGSSAQGVGAMHEAGRQHCVGEMSSLL